jgi:hypothetical protein
MKTCRCTVPQATPHRCSSDTFRHGAKAQFFVSHRIYSNSLFGNKPGY